MDKEKILKLYEDVKEKKKQLEDLSKEELIYILKLYNQEINLIKEKITTENQEIDKMKKRIEKLMQKK